MVDYLKKALIYGHKRTPAFFRPFTGFLLLSVLIEVLGHSPINNFWPTRRAQIRKILPKKTKNAAYIASPKALKSYFSTGLSAIFIHPVIFYCSPFLFGYAYTFSIVNLNSAYFLHLLLFAMPYIVILINFEERMVTYGIYVLCRSSRQMGHFRKKSAETLRGETHTRRFKIWQYVADTKGRQKVDWRQDEKGKERDNKWSDYFYWKMIWA